MSGILRDLYSIRSRSHSDRFALTEKYSKELKSWRSSMAHFLDTDRPQAAPLVPIFQRQRNALNLGYWHTVILTHRPLLLNNFAKLSHGHRRRRDAGVGDASSKAKSEQSTQICLAAAMSIVDTVNDLIDAGQLFRAYWVSLVFWQYQASSLLTLDPVHTLLRILRIRDPLRVRHPAMQRPGRDVHAVLPRRRKVP